MQTLLYLPDQVISTPPLSLGLNATGVKTSHLLLFKFSADTYPELQATNAIASLVLPNALQNRNDNQFHDLSLTRGVPVPNEELMLGRSDLNPLPCPPARLPSKLSPPGDHKLTIQLEKNIGYGRIGLIFEVSVLQLVSDTVKPRALPPLVAKISMRTSIPYSTDTPSDRLARDAFYYEEMECLPGVVLPRCYGYFQTMIPTELMFDLWQDELWRPSDAEYFDRQQKELDHTAPASVSVLLLERLGPPMPVGKPLWGTRKEILRLYSVIAYLGIEHSDIRWSNILSAPNSAPGLAGLPSPFTGWKYNWRLVDFDLAFKLNMSIEENTMNAGTRVGPLIRELPGGYIHEPWH